MKKINNPNTLVAILSLCFITVFHTGCGSSSDKSSTGGKELNSLDPGLFGKWRYKFGPYSAGLGQADMEFRTDETFQYIAIVYISTDNYKLANIMLYNGKVGMTKNNELVFYDISKKTIEKHVSYSPAGLDRLIEEIKTSQFSNRIDDKEYLYKLNDNKLVFQSADGNREASADLYLLNKEGTFDKQ